jgi:hypothetical protein
VGVALTHYWITTPLFYLLKKKLGSDVKRIAAKGQLLSECLFGGFEKSKRHSESS